MESASKDSSSGIDGQAATRFRVAGYLRSVGSFFARIIPSGLPVPILLGPLRGYFWISGAAAGKGKGLARIFNLVEPEQLAAAESLAKSGSVCFDIGANVGHYTLLFGRVAERVIAFEPLPRNLSYLERLVAINRLRAVTIVPWAVSEGDTLCSFSAGENPAVGALDVGGIQPVATVSCDSFIQRYGIVPDVIKIDVEGAEVRVLDGARQLLRSRHPKILLSTHGDKIKADCLALLADVGYTNFAPLDASTAESATELIVT